MLILPERRFWLRTGRLRTMKRTIWFTAFVPASPTADGICGRHSPRDSSGCRSHSETFGARTPRPTVEVAASWAAAGRHTFYHRPRSFTRRLPPDRRERRRRRLKPALQIRDHIGQALAAQRLL